MDTVSNKIVLSDIPFVADTVEICEVAMARFNRLFKTRSTMDGECISRADAGARIRDAFQQLADAITGQATKLGMTGVGKMWAADWRTACADLIPIVQSKSGEILQVPQFHAVKKRDKKTNEPTLVWILCAGGKLEVTDKTLKDCVIREGMEELRLREEAINGCNLIGLFDAPEHDDRGRMALLFTVAISETETFEAYQEMKDDDVTLERHSLESIRAIHEKELVDTKGKLYAHMVYRKVMCDLIRESTKVSEWKLTPEPKVYGEPEVKKLKATADNLSEKVVPKELIEKFEAIFKTAIKEVQALKDPSVKGQEWSSEFRDEIFTKQLRSWVQGDHKRFAFEPQQRLTVIDGVGVEVKVGNAYTQVGHFESCADAAFRLAMAQAGATGPLSVQRIGFEKDEARGTAVAEFKVASL